MPFEKGCAPGPGRPPGSKKASLKRTADLLAELNRDPIEELIAIVDQSSDLELKSRIWMFIQKYREAEQIIPPKLVPVTPSDSVENANATMEKLKALADPVEPDAKSG